MTSGTVAVSQAFLRLSIWTANSDALDQGRMLSAQQRRLAIFIVNNQYYRCFVRPANYAVLCQIRHGRGRFGQGYCRTRFLVGDLSSKRYFPAQHLHHFELRSGKTDGHRRVGPHHRGSDTWPSAPMQRFRPELRDVGMDVFTSVAALNVQEKMSGQKCCKAIVL